MAGRPTKLTPEISATLVRVVSVGVTRRAAADYAGIGLSTLSQWLARGHKAHSGPYREFVDAINRAEAEAVITNVGIIQAAANKEWQAAAWWLERRYPDEWGRKDRIELGSLIRQQAEQIAGETGLNVEEIIANAEAILRST